MPSYFLMSLGIETINRGTTTSARHVTCVFAHSQPPPFTTSTMAQTLAGGTLDRATRPSRIQKARKLNGQQNVQGSKHAGGRQTLDFLLHGLISTQFPRFRVFACSSWTHT
ncbi:uncharacterized protein F5147DRAFT_777559 [Suillus discolor]|uniref:Uncharacterized protein n=1 Tax=Suillus discolor TaxID=1912936 RepID=A0A9P7EZ04_9AGAM|nr:uncharacterized protein F5147DRAFT_777559 [Suillus discolor]KAG2098717.1 hypothetical protein F5147DRAFT_777559 [Suillus discolor]